MFITRSLIFYPDYFENISTELSDEIIIPSYYLNILMNRFEDGEMLYVNINNIETNQSYLVSIGSSHNYDKNTIFAPQWILDLIGCSGCCNSVIVIEKADVSNIPPATKITIKPLDSVAFDINTHECFENAFMNLHSIKEGITIPISIPELGKEYQMLAYIEKVEPQKISRIVHGEVEVEFINEYNQTNINDSIPIIPSISENQVDVPILARSILTSPIKEIDNEERRKKVRESWIKRFCKNATEQ
jgi:hypothetical protein